jgi:hypothetical protein
MNSTELIIVLTGLIELGLTVALIFRSSNPEPTETHPHFKVLSNRFYRSKQRDDGTWEIG